MEVSFIPCSKEDLDDLVQISRQTFTAAFSDQNNPDDFEKHLNSALSASTLQSELKNPHSHFYFVFLQEQLVGYFKYNETEAQTDLKDPCALELERIYILFDYQKRGIGRAVINWVGDKAREASKDYLWLGVWEKNPGAIAFYESLGFEKFGKHPFYIGDDKQMDWLMRLNLHAE